MVNCVTLIFLSFVVIFEASKIRDRFDLDAWKRASCTVAHPKLGEKFGFRDRYDQLTGTFQNIYGLSQCNISYVLDASVGYRLSDGNYTGTLGLAQRHEVDFPLGAVRPAVLEDDIVDLGRVFATTGLMAISSKGEVKIVPIEMLNIFVKLNVGTDGVASQPVPEIDKVEDLVTQTTFQDVHMMIYQGLFFYQVFRDSSEGTLPKKLYNRMLTTDKPQGQWAGKLDHCSFLEARYADSEHTGFTRSSSLMVSSK
ncbi:hypothetical protein HDE_04486 [Halotydeus destructor]|nr:hypothetical protein HDE_04486 [Halotydeus destructor]